MSVGVSAESDSMIWRQNYRGGADERGHNETEYDGGLHAEILSL